MSEDSKAIRTLIIDDEHLARDVIRHMLQRHPDFEITGECSSAKQALRTIRGSSPHLAFVDIEMPGMKGLDFASSLQDYPEIIIVFVTAYSEFALEAFEKNATDYLLKPFDRERFDQMIRRVRLLIEQRHEANLAKRLKSVLSQSMASPPTHKPRTPSTATSDRFVVKDNGKVLFINVGEIQYFEASGNYVALHGPGKTHLIHETLSSLERRLDADTFVRIHRSTIVNLRYVKELQPHFNGEFVVILKGGTRLKISRTYSDAAKERLGIV